MEKLQSTISPLVARFSQTSKNTLMAGVIALALVASIATLAASPTQQNTAGVTTPDSGSVKAGDFQIKSTVKPRANQKRVNTEVLIDGHVVISKTHSTTHGFSGRQKLSYSFSSGAGNRVVFDRQVLKPGNHTVAVVLRDGNKAGSGRVLAVNKKNFRIQNVSITTDQDSALQLPTLKAGQVVQGPRSGQ